MAGNNFDRMHRGELTPEVQITNRATQKRTAQKRRALKGWLAFFALGFTVVFLGIVGVLGNNVKSMFLGVFGWAGIAVSLVAVTLCLLGIFGVLRRKRKWTKAHASLIAGVVTLFFVLLLLLHLALEKQYILLDKAQSLDDGTTVDAYRTYLNALLHNGNTSVGGVLVGWIAFPFLNSIGQRISCIILAVLFGGVLLAMIWPFWLVTQSRVVGDRSTEPEGYAPSPVLGEEAAPTLFVDTVDGEKTTRSRRSKSKREIFDIAYPNKELEEEDEAIDRIDENDPTYKRLMQGELDPEKRKLMAKELLLDMTDEEAKRYLHTPADEYDPAKDNDSPLRYGDRQSTHAQFGASQDTPPRTTREDGYPAREDLSRRYEKPSTPLGKNDAYGILFGEEPPKTSNDFYSSMREEPHEERPTEPSTSPVPPVQRQIPREGNAYVVNPRRTLDDLPRRARTQEAPTPKRETPPEPPKPALDAVNSFGQAQTDERRSILTPSDADGVRPKQYPAFAEESSLDRALDMLDNDKPRRMTTPEEDKPRRMGMLFAQNEPEESDDDRYRRYQDEEEPDEEQDEDDKYDEYDEENDEAEEPDPDASKGYVEREEAEFPSAFDGFVARAMPDPEEEIEEEQDEDEDEDVKPRYLAVPNEKTERQARACLPKPEQKKVRPYTAPSLYLLRDYPPPVDMEDYEVMYHNIEDAFASYGMQVRVLGHTRGPTYTQYAVQLADGLTFKRVAGYEQDIVRKMRLSEEINLVAKVPNMDAIGVEVVNRTRSTVGLKPLLSSSVFRQDKKLYFALGVDVMGHPYYCDILSGPHMLIAGSSGSGKSVCLNTLLCCLLFNYKPDYVKFILIDPKGGVEMDVYNDLPHNMLGQAATTPVATLKALDWAIEEMERRYALMRTVNIRSLGDYNDKMVQANMPRLPYILVVVDELADLMKLNKKMAADIESRIARLTAKARACGIHVIVATQRPSVDVITGTIKNNIPTRVAFRTATQIDSKTILERGCAEKLYGKGDMFLMANGANELKRLQCPFLSDDEVFAICEDIRANNDCVVDPSIAARVFKEEAADDMQIEEDFGLRETKPTDDNPDGDPLFVRAVRFVAQQGSVSISRIQREFRVGFARAGYLVDEMEKRGFIGPAEPNGSNRPRAVLVTPQDCDEIFGDRGREDDE